MSSSRNRIASSNRSTSLVQSSGVLDELQDSLIHGSLARRVDLLRRVTDLFMHGAEHYSEDHISVFDDVFECLVSHIHHEAQIQLSQRIAPVATAPRRLIRHLAMHDLIEVASPVLAQSDRIDDETLIEVARAKDQPHLLAIAARPTLRGAVTDILVERGNHEVVCAVTGNPHAELTDRGYDTLVQRGDDNDWIATCIQMRPSMPRHHYVRLVAKASDKVRAQLAANFPQAPDAVEKTIASITERARRAPASFSEQTVISHQLVQLLHDDGRLDDRQVGQFAMETQFDEVCAALACMSGIPVTLAETMMVEAQEEGLFMLGKVCGLSWPTVREIVALRVRLGHQPESDPDAGRAIYQQLHNSTAHQVLRFHRMQITAMAM